MKVYGDFTLDELLNDVIEESQKSNALRLKVGALIMIPRGSDTSGVVIGLGHNHMHNDGPCEYEVLNGSYVSYNEVLHAETEAIKDAITHGYGNQLLGSIVYLTDSPCVHCAKALYSVGVKKVYYINKYRLTDALDFLESVGVECIQVSKPEKP